MTTPSDVTWVHYLPAATTVVAAAFAFTLFRKYRARPTPHIGWWAAGVATYGTGTLLETVITLSGNTVVLTKLWYVAGAVLGAYPLAQGSVYLLNSRHFANRATIISLPLVVVTALLVLLSPVVAGALEPHRPFRHGAGVGMGPAADPVHQRLRGVLPGRRRRRQRVALPQVGEHGPPGGRQRPDRSRGAAARNRRHDGQDRTRGSVVRGRVRRSRPHLGR